MKMKNAERMCAGMAAGIVFLILMLAGGASLQLYEIASRNMIFDHRDRKQDWW